MLKFEGGNTIQFTFVSTIAPNAAPIFSVIDDKGTVLTSETSQQSNATNYYAMFTMPNSPDKYFVGRWLAQKTVASSVRDFVRRFGFKVDVTTVAR